MLAALPEPAREAVVAGMSTIARLLSDQPSRDWHSRHPAPGDIGWVIERHGALYAEEYNFNHKFEALVAQVAGAFLDAHAPNRERGWIAERDGVRIGSVFLVRKTDDLCKLRLLLVEPSARGLGVGKRAAIYGLVVYDFYDRLAERHAIALPWLASGQLKFHEDASDGLETAPAQFERMLRGQHLGKAIVRVAPDKP